MPTPDDWNRLGELLKRRRVLVDRRYRKRELFAEERGVNLRLVSDIEQARRANFTLASLLDLEDAYELAQGNIEEILAGGELRPRGAAAPSTDGRPAEAVTSQDPGPAQDSVPYGIQLAELERELVALTEQVRRYREEHEEQPPQANGGERQAS